MDVGKSLHRQLLKPWHPKHNESTPLKDEGVSDVVPPPDDASQEEVSKSLNGNNTKYDFKPASVSVHKSEWSMRARKKRVQGHKAFATQVQRCHWLVKDWADVPYRDGLHYEGSNRGACIGPLHVPGRHRDWKMSVAEKKEVYGELRTIVQGDGDEPATPRQDEEIEPICHHVLPWRWYSELLHRTNSNRLCDFSMGNGMFIMLMVYLRLPSLGVAMTQKHATLVHERLVHWTLMCMTNPKFKGLYIPRAAAAFSEDGVNLHKNQDTEAEEEQAKPQVPKRSVSPEGKADQDDAPAEKKLNKDKSPTKPFHKSPKNDKKNEKKSVKDKKSPKKPKPAKKSSSSSSSSSGDDSGDGFGDLSADGE